MKFSVPLTFDKDAGASCISLLAAMAACAGVKDKPIGSIDGDHLPREADRFLKRVDDQWPRDCAPKTLDEALELVAIGCETYLDTYLPNRGKPVHDEPDERELFDTPDDDNATEDDA